MTTWTLRGGEAYLAEGERIEIYRVYRASAEVRRDAGEVGGWSLIAVGGGRAPQGWRLAGLARPSARMHDGREVWRVPGPPWGASLTWAGPGAPLVLHGTGQRPGWLGPVAGPVSAACPGLAGAQAAADAWWLGELAALVTRGQPGGQQSLFGDAPARWAARP